MRGTARIYYDSSANAYYCISKYIELINNANTSFYKKIQIRLLKNILHKNYGIIIGNDCKIDECPFFPHPQNIVIGLGVKMGKNCDYWRHSGQDHKREGLRRCLLLKRTFYIMRLIRS